jgi:hypothetical protein
MPEVEAVVSGFNGETFVKGDVGSLAEALARLFRRDVDSNRMYADCRYVIDRYYNPARQLDLMIRALSGEDSLPVEVMPPGNN